MSFVESINIFSINDKLNIESDNLKICKIYGLNDRKLKLQIEKLDVPKNVEYEISNLTIENDVLNKLNPLSINLSNCTIQNIESLKYINEKKYRELKNVTLQEENIIVNTSEAIAEEYKMNIDCSKVKQINQELLNNLSMLYKDGEQLTIYFTMQQLKEIKENGFVIDHACEVCTTIENASELSAEETKDMMEKLNLKYIKITPKENELESSSHHIYKASEYQKSREVLDKVLEGINPNEPDKAKLLSEIYKRLAFHMSYDYDAVNDDKLKKERKVSSRNLVGGLLQGKCVCAGYAEILRNACSICNIECRYVGSKEDLSIDESGKIDQETHAFNQVKIDGVWYNADLTWDRDKIVTGKLPKYFLKSDFDFKKMGSKNPDGKYDVIRTHVPRDNQKSDKCNQNYPEDKINKYFSTEKNSIYLVPKGEKNVAFDSPDLRLKNKLERLERLEKELLQKKDNKENPKDPINRQRKSKIINQKIKHKCYKIDIVDDKAVLYPDGKDGQALGIEVLKSYDYFSHTKKELSPTELVTKEILEDRAKGNLKENLRTSKSIEDIRNLGDGSLKKGLALLTAFAATTGITLPILINNNILNINDLMNATAPTIAGATMAGAFALDYINALKINLYNSTLARRIRGKFGISPDPKKLRTDIGKSSNRIIKTYSTKKANPRTPIKYINKKNDQLLYNIMGKHLPYSPEFDSAIEQNLIENELHLRSVELCDGIKYKHGYLEEDLFNGEVYVAKYWRTKNHTDPKNIYQTEDYQTHKDTMENINKKDISEREVVGYYKRDLRGKLYMFGMGDKDTTVFYDMEEPLSIDSQFIKKGMQKEITTAEEIMGIEIQTKATKLFKNPRKVYNHDSIGEDSYNYINENIKGKVKDVIKIDGTILGYPETTNKKSKDGLIRTKDTSFFLVSVADLEGKESYYFLDSNYTYKKVDLSYNAVFGNCEELKDSKSQEILVNISPDENKPEFETRTILSEFESVGFDENGNPCQKMRIAVTRNSDGQLQVIEPYGTENGKRYATLLPQTVCMDEIIREKYKERHGKENDEFKGGEMPNSFCFEKIYESYKDYGITASDISNQKPNIINLVNPNSQKQTLINEERDDNDGRNWS